jgi:hypothetical protein
MEFEDVIRCCLDWAKSCLCLARDHRSAHERANFAPKRCPLRRQFAELPRPD